MLSIDTEILPARSKVITIKTEDGLDEYQVYLTRPSYLEIIALFKIVKFNPLRPDLFTDDMATTLQFELLNLATKQLYHNGQKIELSKELWDMDSSIVQKMMVAVNSLIDLNGLRKANIPGYG
jgi:hypothetical protein